MFLSSSKQMELLTQACRENAKKFFKFLGACDYEDDKIEENRNNFKVIQINCNKNEVSPNSLEGDINMKGITLRKDGRYVIRKTMNGVRITKYAKTLKEAQKIYTKIKKNKINDIIERKYTVTQWSEEWLETYKKPFVSETSCQDIKNYLLKIQKQFGKLQIKHLTTNNIQLFLNTLPKTRTKEKLQIYFNAMLQKAEDLSIIDKNPFKAVIKEKKLKCKNECFNFKEQKLILDSIKNTNIEKEIYIYLLTGCRPNELPASKNFDFKNNIITINGTKNENAKERKIEMSENFANYIKPYIEKNKRPKVSEISKTFKDICVSNNIEKPLLYRLRHTFATNHFTLGTNSKQVQQWLGHYSVSLTLDIYTDIDKTATKEKIEKLYNNFYYENG